MKILQVCAYAASYTGNFMSALYELEKVISSGGVTTIYAFPEKAKKLEWVHELQKRTKVYFLPLVKARIKPTTYYSFRKIYKENPDIQIVHSHFELYDVPATIMAPKNVKVFWHLHDPIGDSLPNIVDKLQYGLFHRKKATLLSVSEKHMNYAISLGFPKARAHYLPNGIDTKRIHFLENGRKPYWDFLLLGWDFKRKGVDLCIDAMQKIHRPIKIGIVGGVQTKDTIHELYDEMQGVDLVRPVEDVNELYRQTNCFLHISRAEGLSYALLEAIYAGLYVICSDISENLFAREFPTVTMVKNEDVDSISAAMINYYGKKPDDNAILASRKIIDEKYSLEIWTKKVLQYYSATD